MSDTLPADTFFDLPAAEITLDALDAQGWILDIGGGGEGVIGQLKPAQVIAVDHSWRELSEAPTGPLKLVQDAGDLGFPDSSFATATLFFSLMFLSEQIQLEVFRELHRVLRSGGSILIWDAPIPTRAGRKPEYPCIHVQVHLPGKILQTDYGRSWPDQALSCARYKALAQAAGFSALRVEEKTAWFFMHLQKR